MAIDQRKHEHKHSELIRDVRPIWMRIADGLRTPSYSSTVFLVAAGAIWMNEWALAFADLIFLLGVIFFLWLNAQDRSVAFKLPMGSKYKDKNNEGSGRDGEAEGILYLGNVEKSNEEIWFTNSDARTHILYLGTTGAGKTEGLKSMVSNALAWGSGFVYIDGKADTDLWSSLSSLCRRFGRDDDLLVLNYMTGNSDIKAPSNTMNPFSSGSASYLTNMLVSLMPESEGDNAMWKERAVSLVSAMMPVMTWKRDNQDVPLSVRNIRDNLSLNNVIKLARDEAVPIELREGMIGYLDTLPGFVHEAYDDNGQTKPPGPDVPQYDTTTANQQHGYLAMQFTRSLQSLGDDYGYIFDTQAADVEMVDVVLNRRILVVLIPALEKSGDEIANLGKIVASTMKGMMGSTLGSTVEGSSDTVIENKPTHSSTPFMTVFDEVGYYAAAGMAVMAAQARSLGFCLIFSSQDLPAMKKRVREEANSITANCNIKIFGKLEDPTETKEFFEKTVGQAYVTEVSGFQTAGSSQSYHDTRQAGVQMRARASYEELRSYKEGQAIMTFGDDVYSCNIFYSNPGFAKAMRVTRFISLPPADDEIIKYAGEITAVRDLMVNKTWTAKRSDVDIETPKEIDALIAGFKLGEKAKASKVDVGITSLVQVYALDNEIEAQAQPPAKAAASENKAATPTAKKPPIEKTTQPPQDKAPPIVPPLPKKAAAPKTTGKVPPTVSPPATAPQQEQKSKTTEDKKAPMSFFGTPKDNKAEISPPPEKKPQPDAPKKKTESKSFSDLTNKGDKEETTKDTKAPAQPAKPRTGEGKLPEEILDIIEGAAKKGKKSLFRGDGENIDAAE